MLHYTGMKAGEVFVGNTPTKDGMPEYLKGLRTARLGEQALDLEGKKLDPAYMRPLFVGNVDANEYHRIMMRRTFPGGAR